MKNSLRLTFLLLCTFSLFSWNSQAQQSAIHVTSIEGHDDHALQEPGRNCHAQHVLDQHMLTNPALKRRMMDMEEKTQRFIQEHRGSYGRFSRVIPVNVHVIYRTSQENISNAQIQSQIDQINADFAATNADYSPPSDFAAVASGNTGIQFVLNNVTRKYVNRTSWGTNDAMKIPSQGGVAPENPATELNMWVCNIGGGILGYAQFPGGSAATDGVVMSPQYFGSNNYGSGYYLSAPFDKGRTTTHEIGHYLNLRHIWGDGGCNMDDFVDDTPVAGQSNGGCPSATQNTCAGGQRDMHMNYMDYTNDDCMYMFSAGQKARMQACLNGPRAQLGTTGTGGGGGGGNTTCAAAITLSITTDNYGSETTWTIKNASGTTVASGSGYGNNSTYNPTISLVDGNYTFTINDAYGDGICCSYGNGSYTLRGDGQTIATGGAFGATASHTFCVQGGNTGGGTGSTCNTGNVTDSYDSNFEGWTNSNSDDFNWERRSGSTPSSGTGPSSAYNGSHYIYMESSSPNYSTKNAIITAPCQYVGASSSSPAVSFRYHMYGANNMGTLRLQISKDGGAWTTIWSESGNQGNAWLSASVSLNSYKGSDIQLRFNGTTGTTWKGDMAVDYFRLTGMSANRQADATALAANAPEVMLFPNPAKNSINVELSNIEQPLTSRILDATGRTLWMGNLEAGQNAVNISSLPAGLYYLAIVKENGEVMTEKFVKK